MYGDSFHHTGVDGHVVNTMNVRCSCTLVKRYHGDVEQAHGSSNGHAKLKATLDYTPRDAYLSFLFPVLIDVASLRNDIFVLRCLAFLSAIAGAAWCAVSILFMHGDAWPAALHNRSTTGVNGIHAEKQRRACTVAANWGRHPMFFALIPLSSV